MQVGISGDATGTELDMFAFSFSFFYLFLFLGDFMYIFFFFSPSCCYFQRERRSFGQWRSKLTGEKAKAKEKGNPYES